MWKRRRCKVLFQVQVSSWPYWRGRHQSRTDLGILKTGRSLSCREQSAELTHSTAPVSSGPSLYCEGEGGGKRGKICTSASGRSTRGFRCAGPASTCPVRALDSFVTFLCRREHFTICLNESHVVGDISFKSIKVGKKCGLFLISVNRK